MLILATFIHFGIIPSTNYKTLKNLTQKAGVDIANMPFHSIFSDKGLREQGIKGTRD